ncbi:MAG: RagB/SusD family nutrient uptake outer membrane protein [Bacteroidetes bacterium]|nr:RagB/SusD family nutrient uptake outer membrane protein [Bacteroidota bacterium]
MKRLTYFILFSLAFLSNSCKDFLDVNADPNNPQAIPLESRLVGAITMSNGASMWRAAREIAAVCQYASAPTATNAAETWRFSASNFFWQNAYTWAIPNCVDMVVLGKAEGSPHFAGAGRTLEALNFGMLTDQYGSIPVKEAYDGITTARLTPAFDSQEAVYKQIIEKLDEAIVLFNDSGNKKNLNLDKGDIMYQGDINKWRRFAYALKARYLNHLSKKKAYNAQAVLDACANAFNADGMDAEYPYLDNGSATDANPWSIKGYGGFTSATAPRYFSYTQFFVNLLSTTPVTNATLQDPRIGIIMNPAPSDGQFRGLIPGQGVPGGVAANGNNYGRVTGGFYARPTSPYPFITYAEVKFIEAEARLRSGNKTAALAAYQEGVRANMRRLGVPAAQIDAFWSGLVTNGVQQHFDNLTTGLSHIMRQKYIALVFNPETWVDMRRMDYSKDIYGPSLNRPINLNPLFAEGEWIRGMIMEGNEEVRNGANVGDNSPALRLKTPLWWDTKD